MSIKVETGCGNWGETGLILPRSCRQESETESIPTPVWQALYESLNNGSRDGRPPGLQKLCLRQHFDGFHDRARHQKER
jgi:hypothetical protein